MRRLAWLALMAVLAACTPSDDGADIGSFDPAPHQSGAPLRDDAVGPDETPQEIDDG